MMNLQEEKINASIYFKEYVDGVIKINVGNYDRPVVVVDNQIVAYRDEIKSVNDIQVSHLELMLKSNPEVILIGTGVKQTLPAISIVLELAKQGRSADFMSSEQACKTYNLLINEDRNVSCIII